MKKIHYILLSLVSVCLLVGVVWYFGIVQKNTASQESLAELQKVLSTGSGKTQEAIIRLSPEKQKQLDQIGDIYENEKETHLSQIIDTLRKYKSDASQNEKDMLVSLVEKSISSDILKKDIKEQLGVSFLESDIRNLFASKEKLLEEKELELTRLQLFEESNKKDIKDNTQILLQLTLQESLTKHTTLETSEREKIVTLISGNIFKTPHILDLDTFEKQELLLRESIAQATAGYDSLSNTEKEILSKQMIDDISKLDILLDPDKKTSFISPASQVFESLQKLGFFVFSQTYASETASLTSEEREILILKTEILIDRILGESIEAEIRYNKNTLSEQEYSNIIEQNLIELEELVILKESLENDAEAISLEDIQRFQLGSYVDDSIAIQNLPVLAYIQEKNGHIIIHNLNTSSKLGEENMSLYSGYGIETLDNSTTTLVFSDESILRLDPLSRVNITTPSTTNITVEVEKGNIWTRVLKPLLSGDTFTIESGDISLGVRGTSLSLSKGSTGATVYVVDSYTSDGSPSVSMTEKASGKQSPVATGKKISVLSTGAVVSSYTKSNLLAQKPEISTFLREDLKYLSLLLDDRNRGFYNTPLIAKNDSEDFLQKIAGELQVSLPQGAEKPYILKNPELAAQLVNSGSIYHLVQKDTLISDIKNNPLGNTAAKVQAVRDLDMISLEKELGHKRDLENRFDYNISQNIISKNTFTTAELKNIFLDFPLVQAQSDAKLLEEVKKNLSINGGNSIVSKNIALPTSLSGVYITWKSENITVISSTGAVTIQDVDTSVILAATLKLGDLTTTKDFGLTVIAKEPSELDQLKIAEALLSKYLQNAPTYGRFTDSITLPDFSENGGITPIITWSGSTRVNTNGTTNRPSFTESPINEYPSTNVTAILVHPTSPKILTKKTYTIAIKRKSQTLQELANASLLLAKETFKSYFFDSVGNPKTISVASSSLPYPLLPLGVKVNWKNGLSYVDTNGIVTHPSYNTGDQTLTLIATFSHLDTIKTETISNIKFKILKKNCDGILIGTAPNEVCYSLMASAEYNAPGEFNLITPTGKSYTGSAVNVNLSTCGGDTTGNCGWTNTGAITTKYGYKTSLITKFNKVKSWIQYDGEAGVVVDNEASDDYISYDLSPFALGTDWVIEMSVRGEDLKRPGQHYLFASPTVGGGNFAIYNKIGTYNALQFIYSGASPNEIITKDITGEISNGYNKIFFTPTQHYIEGFGTIQNNNTGALLANTIKIGSNGLNGVQWNGIINNLRIYKKK